MEEAIVLHKTPHKFSSFFFFSVSDVVQSAVSSALQAGRDESDKVDEAQAVQDAKARVQVLYMKVCVSIMTPSS